MVGADQPTATPTLRDAVTGQRRIVQVGALFVLGSLVLGLGLGEPAIGGFFAAGVALAVINAVLTEHSMARMVATLIGSPERTNTRFSG